MAGNSTPRTISILVVEDDPVVQKIMMLTFNQGWVLSHLGFKWY